MVFCLFANRTTETQTGFYNDLNFPVAAMRRGNGAVFMVGSCNCQFLLDLGTSNNSKSVNLLWSI